MSNTLFLHIGYPKTGTTALQRHVFPALRDSGFFYAGSNEQKYHHVAIAFGELVQSGLLQDGQAMKPGQDNLISCEGIVSDCLKFLDSTGRFNPRPAAGLAERTLTAARLYGADDTRVIVILRRQDELSHSLYAQSYTHYFSRFAELREYRDYALRIIAHDSIAAAYDFFALVTSFQRVFGADRVLIMFYEDLARDPRGFLNQLSGFLGSRLPDSLPEENVRLTAGNARITQPYSLRDMLEPVRKHVLPRTRLGIGKYLRFLHDVPVRRAALIARQPDLEQQVLDSFHDSNIRLAEITGRDLSVLGYY